MGEIVETEGTVFGNTLPIKKETNYSSNIHTDDILFIPEYIYKAINSSGVSVEQYIDVIKAAKTSPNFKEMYDLFYNESAELKAYAKTLQDFNQKIYNTIGSEINNLIQIQKFIISVLGISTYRDDNSIEYIFIRGLNNLNNGNRYVGDNTPINLLKTNNEVKFEDTYVIVNSDICLIILKDGFGNYIDDSSCKKILLDEILDSRQLFMGSMVFGSDFMKSSIELNLSNS